MAVEAIAIPVEDHETRYTPGEADGGQDAALAVEAQRLRRLPADGRGGHWAPSEPTGMEAWPAFRPAGKLKHAPPWGHSAFIAQGLHRSQPRRAPCRPQGGRHGDHRSEERRVGKECRSR